MRQAPRFCIDDIIVEKGAIDRVAEVVLRYHAEKVFLLADRNTYEAAGKRIYENLLWAGFWLTEFCWSKHFGERAEISTKARRYPTFGWRLSVRKMLEMTSTFFCNIIMVGRNTVYYRRCVMVNTNYSEKQLKIISGEIPLEKVHTNELISIHKKAYNVGDHVLAETVLNKIFIERQRIY